MTIKVTITNEDERATAILKVSVRAMTVGAENNAAPGHSDYQTIERRELRSMQSARFYVTSSNQLLVEEVSQ